MRTIKRYANRRLYDTECSRTVTQSEVAKMVRSGVELKIVQSSTGKDITAAVLGRTMLAEAESWRNMAQIKELFTDLITYGGTESMSVLRNTILASIGAIQVTKAKAEKIIDDLIKKGDLDRSNRKKAVMELLEKAEKSTASWRKKVSNEAGKAQTEVSKVVGELKKFRLASQADLKKIETKIDRLTKKVSALEKRI